ncbi:hypothetical protein IXO812_16985, partial [Xanthomonas oryzae pv. oryzae]
MHPIGQLLATAQRAARYARALGVAPHQLVGIQVRRVTRQEMQRQPALQAVHVIAHATGLVSRQTIKHQMDWTATGGGGGG